MAEKTNIHVIRTPEGIVFSQLLAGPVARSSAWFIDLMVIMACMTALNYALILLQVISPDFARAMSALGYFVISIGYGALCEWGWRGQTIGKRMLRLRVVDAQGLRLQFNQIMMRNLLRFVDCLPGLYFVGGVACLMNRKCQRLGDLAANTIVVRYPRVTEPDLEQLLAGKFNSLRQYPHLESAAASAHFCQRKRRCCCRHCCGGDEFEPRRALIFFVPWSNTSRPRRSFRRKRRMVSPTSNTCAT